MCFHLDAGYLKTSRKEKFFPIWVFKHLLAVRCSCSYIWSLNSFYHVSSQVLRPSEEKSLSSRLMKHESNYVFDRHFYIFDRNNVPNTKVIIAECFSCVWCFLNPKSWHVHLCQEMIELVTGKILSVHLLTPQLTCLHFYFQVNMINMIREPVDRVVSMFHYLRSAKRWRSKPAPPQEWFKKDMASCVKSGDLECQARIKLSSPTKSNHHNLLEA